MFVCSRPTQAKATKRAEISGRTIASADSFNTHYKSLSWFQYTFFRCRKSDQSVRLLNLPFVLM